MALLSGYPEGYPVPDESGDPADQPTDKLPRLAEARAIARMREWAIPVCPVCLMRYELKTGGTIDVGLSYPSFCPDHKAPHDEGARLVAQYALESHLWPNLGPDFSQPPRQERSRRADLEKGGSPDGSR